jgi:hypothetical protein
MQSAPLNAVFISCHHGYLDHDRYLAFKCGRADLQIVDASWLTSNRWQGLELTGIVIDHDARLSLGEQHYLQRVLTRIRNPQK